YVAESLKYPEVPADVRSEELRKKEFMYRDQYRDQLVRDATRPEGDSKKVFHIIRKPLDKMMALSRLVYNNDYQAKDLKGKPQFQRWHSDDKDQWKPTHPEDPRSYQHINQPGAGDSWLRYRHILRTAQLDEKGNPKPELITDFMGYNTGRTSAHGVPKPNWV